MPDHRSLKALLAELRERKVIRSLIVYIAVAWALIQFTATVFPILDFPQWATKLVVIALLAGVPLVSILSWMFDISRTGLSRTNNGLSPKPRRAWALTAFLVVVALAVGGFFATWDGQPAEPGQEGVVAVFPFVISSRGDLDYLSEGMVTLLATKLDGAVSLRSISPDAIHRALEGKNALRDSVEASQLAQRLGANLFILGSVVGTGDRIAVRAALYESGATTPTLLTARDVSGGINDLFELSDQLAGRLLASRVSRGGIAEAAATTTQSLPALKAYLEGEQAYRRRNCGNVDCLRIAQQAFFRAVEIDSGFALAWYRIAFVSGNLPPHQDVRRALANAQAQRDRLTPRYRELVDAEVAVSRMDSTAGQRRREFVHQYPDEPIGWFRLGDFRYHHNAMHGRSFIEARAAFERADSLDPLNNEVRGHLEDVLLHLRDYAALDRLIASWGVDSVRAATTLLLRAWVVGTPEDKDQALSRWRSANINFTQANRILQYGPDTLITHLRGRVLEVLPRRQASGVHLPARHAIALGRYSDAERALARHGSESLLLLRSLYATMPLVPPRPQLLKTLRDELQNTRNVTSLQELQGLGKPIPEEAWPVYRLYLLGLIAGKLGEDNARYLGELRMVQGSPEIRELANELANGVMADQALRSGRVAVALQTIETFDGERLSKVHFQETPGGARSDLLPPLRERFVRAEALAAAGKTAEAIAWFSTFTENSTATHLPYAALAHFRLGDLYSSADTTRAAGHYARFLAIWSDADPELSPLIESASRKLDKLRAPTR